MALRSLIVGTAVLALSAALAAPVDAQNRGRQHGNHGHYDRGHDRRGEARRDYRRHEQRRHDGRSASRGQYRHAPPRQVVHHRAPPPRYYAPPRHVVRHRAPVVYHAPPSRTVWVRGSHYARHGYGPTYVVHDYRPYGLYAPPYGHHWRRSSTGDFVLVAIATGIIIDAILGHY